MKEHMYVFSITAGLRGATVCQRSGEEDREGAQQMEKRPTGIYLWPQKSLPGIPDGMGDNSSQPRGTGEGEDGERKPVCPPFTLILHPVTRNYT